MSGTKCMRDPKHASFDNQDVHFNLDQVYAVGMDIDCDNY